MIEYLPDLELSVRGKTFLLVQKGEITKMPTRFLFPFNMVPARSYLLPKIHKKNYPDRPIASSTGIVTVVRTALQTAL